MPRSPWSTGQGRARVQSTRLFNYINLIRAGFSESLARSTGARTHISESRVEAWINRGRRGAPDSEGSPFGPAAAFLDGQPGISGRIGEADTAPRTRNDARHTRLGFGIDSGLLSLADGHVYTKSESACMSSSMLRTGLSSVRMGSLP